MPASCWEPAWHNLKPANSREVITVLVRSSADIRCLTVTVRVPHSSSRTCRTSPPSSKPSNSTEAAPSTGRPSHSCHPKCRPDRPRCHRTRKCPRGRSCPLRSHRAVWSRRKPHKRRSRPPCPRIHIWPARAQTSRVRGHSRRPNCPRQRPPPDPSTRCKPSNKWSCLRRLPQPEWNTPRQPPTEGHLTSNKWQTIPCPRWAHGCRCPHSITNSGHQWYSDPAAEASTGTLTTRCNSSNPLSNNSSSMGTSTFHRCTPTRRICTYHKLPIRLPRTLNRSHS